MKPVELSDEESAKLAFMRWVASSNSTAWIPRRVAAEAVWVSVAAWVHEKAELAGEARPNRGHSWNPELRCSKCGLTRETFLKKNWKCKGKRRGKKA